MNYRPSGAAATTKERRRPAGPGQELTADSFLASLARMSAGARLERYRSTFSPRQRAIWIAHYPDEVPIVNGEFEHIALLLADVE